MFLKGTKSRRTSVALFLLVSTPAEAQFQKFRVPGAQHTQVLGINATQWITGYFYSDTDNGAFLRSPAGKFAKFSVPGSTRTVASDANDAGISIGSFDDSQGSTHGFVRDKKGNITKFDFGTEQTIPTAINQRGDVAGYYIIDGGSHYGGFVRKKNGTIKVFEVAKGESSATFPTVMNDTGEIAGYYVLSGQSHGFLRASDGSYTLFDAGGGTETIVTGINQAGLVTGYCDASTGLIGFIRQIDGTVLQFSASKDAHYTMPSSINNAGQVGGYSTSIVKTDAFVRQPDGSIKKSPFHGRTTITSVAGIDQNGIVVGNTSKNQNESSFIGTPR